MDEQNSFTVTTSSLLLSLPIPINLSDYYASLVAFHIPAYHNVDKGWVEVRDTLGKRKISIKAQYFASVASFIQFLNTEIGSTDISFVYNGQQNVMLVQLQKTRNSVQLSPNIARLLSVTDSVIRKTTSFPDIKLINNQISIHCNVVEQSLLYGSMVNVLYVGPVNGTITSPIYMPCKAMTFDTLHFAVRNAHLDHLKFANGQVSITVHFDKRVKCINSSKD